MNSSTKTKHTSYGNENKMTRFHLVFLLIVATLAFILLKNRSFMTQKPVSPAFKDTSLVMWDRQCIDTMKTSRDKARGWAQDPQLKKKIENEMNAAKNMGANCIAIDTPYDAEFSSYLEAWISKAREKNFTIWFRGNFSQWEHWFDYQGELSENDLLTKAKTFITTHPQYFKDGDIFTIAPEAENGGPFDQVEANEHPRFRTFLINEYQTCVDSFKQINKNVSCNWLSMNGGFARRMLDKNTIEKIGGLVTLDHYIKTAEEMTDYIHYFSQTFKAKVAIGEFGSPIPDINGTQTQDQQKLFIYSLLSKMYVDKDFVEGLCYWTMYDGSTSLLNEDYSPKPATQSLSAFYKPAKIVGAVTDKLGRPIPYATVSNNFGYKTQTNESGLYSMLVPSNETITLSFSSGNFGSSNARITVDPLYVYNQNVYLSPQVPSMWYKILLWWHGIS